MLILSRNVHERIIINDHEIVITILKPFKQYSRQIRLGFEASADVTIHREEIYQEIQQEKDAKSNNSQPSLVTFAHPNRIQCQSKDALVGDGNHHTRMQGRR